MNDKSIQISLKLRRENMETVKTHSWNGQFSKQFIHFDVCSFFNEEVCKNKQY